MYLHIGGDVVVRKSNIIAILNMESATLSQQTREFLRTAEEEGFIRSVSSGGIPESLVIIEIDKKSIIYLSPISSTTLKRRADLFTHY